MNSTDGRTLLGDAPAGTTPPTTPGGQGPRPPVPPARPRTKPKRRRFAVRLLIAILVLGLLGGAALVGGAFLFQRSLNKNIERFGDPFKTLGTDRPTVVAKNAQNILLLGSDSRISAGDASAWVRGAQRTDAIMIAHIPADRSGVTVTSIPRDSWVTVPGYGKNKINAAFSFGGPTLMVKTVEKYTGVRIDHVAIIDFTGFKDVTDDLGGVSVTIPKSTYDSASKTHWDAGTQRMDGETALAYVRQRHGLPGGDFDRVKRQQNWIRAVVGKSLAKGTLTNPVKLNSVLQSLTTATSVDDGFTIGEMRATALSLRSVSSSDLTFMTAPIAGTGWSPDHTQAIVLLDTKANKSLWAAVRGDRLTAWQAANPSAALGNSVR